MSYQKDPIDQFLLWLIAAVFHVTWAIVAGIISLGYRLFQVPPEKRLKGMKRHDGWGESGQIKNCPSCQTVNTADSPLCSMCGARL